MKKVLVSQRVDEYEDRNEWRDAIDQKLSLLLMDIGLIPVQVPNLLITDRGETGKLEAWIEAINAEGLVLSGGNDIGSCPNRDQTETHLLNWAIKMNVPVLGICNGMQRLGTYYGASFHKIINHVRVIHELEGKITGKANSFHNFALKECPDKFYVAAVSEDDSIEAIIHKELPWEGWMWHPERDGSDIKRDRDRIRMLFDIQKNTF